MNRIYVRNPNTWFVYSDFLEVYYKQEAIDKGDYGKMKIQLFGGIKIDWSKMDSTTYRTMVKQWGTSHFKTYLRELYLRVPIDYLFQNGSYHLLATDRFNVYAIVELAGSARITHI